MQAGNYVREEILSSFIRLVAHTPELQAYTASKLYTSLKSDISQESLTLAATWIIGEYSEVLLQGGLVDEDNPKPVRPSPTSVAQADECHSLLLDNRRRSSGLDHLHP